MIPYERKLLLVLSAVFLALAAVNLYLHSQNQIHLKLAGPVDLEAKS